MKINRTVPNISNISNNKNPSNREAYFLFIFFLTVLILVYIIPEKMLIKIVFFKYYIDLMAFIFPSVSAFEKYSSFPQTAEFIYSTCIITLPLQAFILHQISKELWISNMKKKTQDELRISLCIFIIIFILLFAYVLLLLPLTSFRVPKFSFRFYHTSKIAFSLVTAIIFFANSFLISMIAIICEQLKKLK